MVINTVVERRIGRWGSGGRRGIGYIVKIQLVGSWESNSH